MSGEQIILYTVEKLILQDIVFALLLKKQLLIYFVSAIEQ